MLCYCYIFNIKGRYLDTAFKGEPEEKIACIYAKSLLYLLIIAIERRGFHTIRKKGAFHTIE